MIPLSDRILIQRIEEPTTILLTDRERSIKGVILAVGLGRWEPGTWWKIKGQWEWLEGHREPMSVKTGQTVLFSSKYNDFAAAELTGTGCDGKGPLERPLGWRHDPMIHLVTERDIFGVLPD